MSSKYPMTDTAIASAADFILNGVQEVKDIHNPNTGKTEPTIVINSKKIEWMSQTVTSNRLGDLADQLENIRIRANQAERYMTKERADEIKEIFTGYYEAKMYAINAKSSETIRDKKNQHNNVIQMFAKQPSPYIKQEEEVQEGFLSGLGLKKKPDQE